MLSVTVFFQYLPQVATASYRPLVESHLVKELQFVHLLPIEVTVSTLLLLMLTLAVKMHFHRPHFSVHFASSLLPSQLLAFYPSWTFWSFQASGRLSRL